MSTIQRSVVLLLTGIVFPAVAQRIVTQDFENGQIAHPFFVHAFDYDDDCCRLLKTHPGIKGLALHLVPNSDVITLAADADEIVDSIRVTLLDFEGGFLGTATTSVVVVRGARDFIVLRADVLGVTQEVSADRRMPGQLTGEPIGPIVELSFQAANEGNALVPGVGAYFDDVTAVTQLRCPADVDQDRDVDLADLATLLSNFGDADATGQQGDLDGDQDVDLSDLAALLSAFGNGCPT